MGIDVSNDTSHFPFSVSEKILRILQITWVELHLKEELSDSFTNYNYVGNTKVSVSIKKLMPTNAHKRDISN